MSAFTQDLSAPPSDVNDGTRPLVRQNRTRLTAASSSSRPTRPVAPGSRLFTQGQTPSPLPPGQFRPSDLLSEEDYKRIRLATVTRALAGGLIGGGTAAMAVRQFAPKRPAANTLVAIGLSAGVITQVLVAVTYLKSEIDPIRCKAVEMSRPVTADGSPIFTDAASVNDTAYAFPNSVTRQPLESAGAVAPPRADEGQWGRLRDGSASEGELRDTFFRPGVPRRDV